MNDLAFILSVGSKYYGKTERGNVIPAQVNHLITTLTRSVQQQLEEKERQKMNIVTVQVMAPSDDESVNSDLSDAEEFAPPTTKEPLKKRMRFKKK